MDSALLPDSQGDDHQNKITEYNQLDNLTKFLCIQKIADRENIII